MKLRDEILRVAAKWVSPPYNADGWRLDVAADLGHSEAFNHYFWQRLQILTRSFSPRITWTRPGGLAEKSGIPS